MLLVYREPPTNYPRKCQEALSSRRSFDAVAIAAGEIAFAPLSELTAEKWQFSQAISKSRSRTVGKQAHGSDQSRSGGDPVHQRERILHFDFGRS
jgi:hypothetical protein